MTEKLIPAAPGMVAHYVCDAAGTLVQLPIVGYLSSPDGEGGTYTVAAVCTPSGEPCPVDKVDRVYDFWFVGAHPVGTEPPANEVAQVRARVASIFAALDEEESA